MIKKLFSNFLFAILCLNTALLYAQGVDEPTDHLKTLAESSGKYIGTAINPYGLLYDKKYVATAVREFNIITPENSLKFRATEKTRGVFSFNDGDYIIRFAQSHQMKIRGHTLVWYGDQPAWLEEKKYSKEEVEEIMHNHIKAVMEHYKGKLYSWDVVNEAFKMDGSWRHNIWYDTIGPDYIEMAFRWAHEADPDVLLFYNDYDCETFNRKSDTVYQLLKKLKDKGVPIDGMGFQAHLDFTTDLSRMDPNIKRFAKLGLETDFTEFDVSTVKGPRMNKRARLNKQAEIYRNVFTECLNNPSCKMVVLWGFTDLYTWMKDFDKNDKPAILDDQFNPKPAYNEIMKALREHSLNIKRGK